MKNKGFTVIELMVGLAIVGVLSSIAIAQFKNYVNRAKASEVVSITEPYKLAITQCGLNADISSCDENNGSIQVGTNGKYGNVTTISGKVIYTFTINDISFKDHNVVFYIDKFDPYSSIKWSCKTTKGFDVNLLPKNLQCASDSDDSQSNVFTDINSVKEFFGGNPIINNVETNPNWFLGGTSKVSYLDDATLKDWCKHSYNCSEPYGSSSYELKKADGTIVTNLDQFCKDGAKGYLVNASSSNPQNAGLVCVKQ